MIEEKKGNIFTSKCQTLVNTVNCMGVMGTGIAYEFRLRYPEMYNRYKELCENHQLQIGMLWLYKSENQKSILNFPTKYDWKQPSRVQYLELGLGKFIKTYKSKEITSIAFPLLGASHGGLSKDESIETMRKYLSNLDIKIEIWHFDPSAVDDLFLDFKKVLEDTSEIEISKKTGVRKNQLDKIKKGITNPKINSISGLLKVKGVGEKSIEKLFQFFLNLNKEKNINKTLFD